MGNAAAVLHGSILPFRNSILIFFVIIQQNYELPVTKNEFSDCFSHLFYTRVCAGGRLDRGLCNKHKSGTGFVGIFIMKIFGELLQFFRRWCIIYEHDVRRCERLLTRDPSLGR